MDKPLIIFQPHYNVYTVGLLVIAIPSIEWRLKSIYVQAGQKTRQEETAYNNVKRKNGGSDDCVVHRKCIMRVTWHYGNAAIYLTSHGMQCDGQIYTNRTSTPRPRCLLWHIPYSTNSYWTNVCRLFLRTSLHSVQLLCDDKLNAFHPSVQNFPMKIQIIIIIVLIIIMPAKGKSAQIVISTHTYIALPNIIVRCGLDNDHNDKSACAVRWREECHFLLSFYLCWRSSFYWRS